MSLGSLTFFTGPMACGKTLELVRHLQLFSEQRIPTICIRPATDTRDDRVQSRSGLSFHGLTVPPDDLDALRIVLDQYDVIGIDEGQFFSPTIIPELDRAMRNGKTILLSGLDFDFRGHLFPMTQALFALPGVTIERSRAVCSVCRKHNATLTQRLRNGEMVGRDDPQFVVEDRDAITYEPRCLEHHLV